MERANDILAQMRNINTIKTQRHQSPVMKTNRPAGMSPTSPQQAYDPLHQMEDLRIGDDPYARPPPPAHPQPPQPQPQVPSMPVASPYDYGDNQQPQRYSTDARPTHQARPSFDQRHDPYSQYQVSSIAVRSMAMAYTSYSSTSNTSNHLNNRPAHLLRLAMAVTHNRSHRRSSLNQSHKCLSNNLLRRSRNNLTVDLGSHLARQQSMCSESAKSVLMTSTSSPCLARVTSARSCWQRRRRQAACGLSRC